MLLAEITAQTRDVVTQSGIGLGSVLAVTFSWARNRSILWAVLAGVLTLRASSVNLPAPC